MRFGDTRRGMGCGSGYQANSWNFGHGIPKVLDLLSAHIETQETLPEHLLKALLNARFFQSGMQSLRQIEFALFDLQHS